MDRVPEHTRYVSGSLTPSKGIPNASGLPNLVVDVGEMASDEVVTISFRVIVDDGTPDGTVISNQGTVDSDQTVPEPTDVDSIDANGDQPTEMTVKGPLQVSGFYVWKFVEWVNDGDGSGSISPNDTMRYWVRFQNTGQSGLTGVGFTDTLPGGLLYDGNSFASSGILTVNGQNVAFSGMTVAVNDFGYIWFDVTVGQPGSYINQGTADSDQTGSVLSDGNGDPTDGNQATVFVAVPFGSGSSNITIYKEGRGMDNLSPDGKLNPGETLRYILTVSNNGSAQATNVRVTDPIPSHTSVIPGSVQTTQGIVVVESPVLTVNLGDLPPGGSASITFDAAVSPNVYAGNLTNQASVNDDGGNPNGSNVSTIVISPMIRSVPALSESGSVKSDPYFYRNLSVLPEKEEKDRGVMELSKQKNYQQAFDLARSSLKGRDLRERADSVKPF